MVEGVVIFFELVGEGRLDFDIDQPAKNAAKGKLYVTADLGSLLGDSASRLCKSW